MERRKQNDGNPIALLSAMMSWIEEELALLDDLRVEMEDEGGLPPPVRDQAIRQLGATIRELHTLRDDLLRRRTRVWN